VREETSGSLRLTIVIPTLNRAALVGRAVESALAQTDPRVEVVVSNNGSSDGTREVLDRFRDPRLRVFHRDVTIPATDHGNFLLDQARGEFFLGLSDDDWIEPDFAGQMLALFGRRPETSFTYSGCDAYYGNVVVPCQTGPEQEDGPEFLARFLAGRRDVCWCACVTRTADLRRIGPIPEGTICGDMFYWTKLAARGPVGCVPARLSHYAAYIPSVENSSRGTPVEEWAREVDGLVRQIAALVESEGGSHGGRSALRADGREFLARSVSGQFVWNSLRGASRSALLRTLPRCLPYLRSGRLDHWLRIAAALTAPRAFLRNRVLAEAERKTGARRTAGEA